MTPSDKLHYPAVTVPFTIRRSEVASVEQVRGRPIVPVIVVASVFTLIIVLIDFSGGAWAD
jgi:hypothetical protein